MKKIAFFLQWMLCGGVENALISLSAKLVEYGNEVTIYVITDRGEFINKIPNKVHLKMIPMPNLSRKNIPVGGTKITVRECIQKRKYILAGMFMIRHLLNRKGFAELNIYLDRIPRLDDSYDIAVNFHMHSPFLVWYLAERVTAEKKITWIHNDFTTTLYNVRSLKMYLDKVDVFFAVAQKLADEFTTLIPEYTDLTQVALNIIPIEEIKKKAEEDKPVEFLALPQGQPIILTVGRLEEQKGYDIAIEVCKELVKNKVQFNWFVLGDGTQRVKLESLVDNAGIRDVFHFLGIKLNPYPYFKNCDMYVQTSKHEGYVTTVTEAKIFNLPIVCTDVSGAREQLIDEVTGDIAAISVKGVFDKVFRLVSNTQRQRTYSMNLSKEQLSENPDWLKIFD